MRVNDSLHGFKVNSATEIKEAGGILYLLTHQTSGAKLAFFDRKDDNKTFAISFNTPPEDDTGVFHIIEHSVLCGSKKFPVKEPFVELLKGSLNTFLNAMTYEDRTVYPVSSRCDKDFYNLTEVYLDAVFYPLMKENPFIFMQEGWHYEYDEESRTLSYNGVVYNEMKGAYSSPDEIAYSEISRMLYRGSSYGKDSGGNPEFIPELTYEKFCELHDKYYHPSLARIYLDGSVDLDSVLPLIDSYLSAFERREDSAELSVKLQHERVRSKTEFEISEDEKEDGKARLVLGYAFSDYKSPIDRIMASVITAHLAASNESPLAKALLDSGLCEDVTLGTNNSIVSTLTVEIKGINPENEDKILEIYNGVIENELRGMDKDSLISNLNQIEFKLRERDLGSFPIGVANALSVYEVWSYGVNPADGLVYEDVLKKVRECIENGYAEALLSKMITDNENTATLLMLPSKTIAKRREMQTREKLKAYEDSLSGEELSEIIDTELKFKAWQNSEDTEEALATLPRLTLDDINQKDTPIPTKEENYLSARLITHELDTRGITYVSLFLDCGDLCAEDTSLLSVLASVMTNLSTENYPTLALKREIKKNLGSLSFSSSAFSNSKKGISAPLFRVNASVLSNKRKDLKRILSEVISKTVFEKPSAVKKILTQTKLYMEEAFSASGESVAIGRLEAMGSSHGKISELLHGYEAYAKIKEYIKEIDLSAEEFMKKLRALLKKTAVKERLTVSVASDNNQDFAKEIASLFPSGEPVKVRASYEPNPIRNEAISIPSQVGFATAGLRLAEAKEMAGELRVARSILSYEYLWNAVRVKGGAYGAGFVPRKDGGLYFYSYRDPSPLASLKSFRGSSDYLRELAMSGQDLTKFIIGALGEYDVLKTPKTAAALASANLLTDWSEEDEKKLRDGIVNTDSASLLRVASLLDGLFSACGSATAASGDCLNSFKDGFDLTLKL